MTKSEKAILLQIYALHDRIALQATAAAMATLTVQPDKLTMALNQIDADCNEAEGLWAQLLSEEERGLFQEDV